MTPFIEESLQKALDIRPSIDMHSVNLTIMKLGAKGEGRGSPYAVETLEDFRRPFDELFDWVSAPKSKIDTKLGRTNLDRERGKDKDNKHYG